MRQKRIRKAAPIVCTPTHDGRVNITGLDPAEVLAALYNGTEPVGLGLLHDLGRDITVEETRKDIEQMLADGRSLYFDDYYGRTFRFSIDVNVLDAHHYDAIAGDEAAAKIIAKLRSEKQQPEIPDE